MLFCHFINPSLLSPSNTKCKATYIEIGVFIWMSRLIAYLQSYSFILPPHPPPYTSPPAEFETFRSFLFLFYVSGVFLTGTHTGTKHSKNKKTEKVKKKKIDCCDS